jgi:hypothetical protein
MLAAGIIPLICNLRLGYPAVQRLAAQALEEVQKWWELRFLRV